MNSSETTPTTSEISGRWVVIGLFAFGLLSTAVLWTDWEVLELHLFWPQPEKEIKQKTFEIPMNVASEQPAAG